MDITCWKGGFVTFVYVVVIQQSRGMQVGKSTLDLRCPGNQQYGDHVFYIVEEKVTHLQG